MTTDQEKKIAIFLPSLNYGNAERTIFNLALGLDRCRYNVDVVSAQADGPYTGDIPALLKLVDLGRGFILNRAKTTRRIPAFIKNLRREMPYVMLPALVVANLVCLCARRFARTPVRVIVNEQNELSTTTGNASNEKQRSYPAIARFDYPWADCAVGPSQKVVDDLLENVGIFAKKSQAICNPGITAKVREKAKVPLNHPSFKRGQPPLILSVGSLSMQKDLGTLLQVINKVRQQQAARLLIPGDGEDDMAAGIISTLNRTSSRADSECCWRFESENIVDQCIDLLFSQDSAQ